MSGRAGGHTVAVLISGEGTNLQALIDASQGGRLDADITTVLSDRADARGLERARRAGISAHAVLREDHTSRAGFEAELAARIDACAPRAIVLAGFMRVLSPAFVERFRGRMLNLHPSLLPRFPGLDTHRRVVEAGDAWHGATVHFVTEALDAGPRVIQYRLAVRPGDTPESLAARVHTGEHLILPRAAAWLASGRLRAEGDIAVLDGRPLHEPEIIEELP